MYMSYQSITDIQSSLLDHTCHRRRKLINFGGALYWIFSWGKGEDNHDGVHSMPKLGGSGCMLSQDIFEIYYL